MKKAIGKVVSDRANKSILVAIDRWRWIPKYKKEIKRTTKLMAHDEDNECRLGDLVQVESSRPISKNKAFRMTRIIQAAKIYNAEESLATAASQRALGAQQAAQSGKQRSSPSRGFAAGVEGWT
ncbi:g8065 [Coccomyxa viridis]|uniref:Small ribosomal subunit protein uS17c n=1 Tax=Coccomyxa viridis TaxID=1274662 RepID=A0ABP1G3J2_9CHLO